METCADLLLEPGTETLVLEASLIALTALTETSEDGAAAGTLTTLGGLPRLLELSSADEHAYSQVRMNSVILEIGHVEI